MKQDRNLKYYRLAACLAILIPIFSGCSHTEKVLIPPKMDLRPYGTVGIIEFSVNAENDLKQSTTQEYIQTVQSAQPGVRILELGGKERVLKKVGKSELDPEAVKAIGSAYHVDVLVYGQLSVSDPKPNLSLSSTWESLQAGADIEAFLMTKLWETGSGATLWTKSSRTRESVASFAADTSGNINIEASDPKDSYTNLVSNLVYANTMDLRSSYEYRKVK
jgi:hypothetical protein